MGIFVVVCGVGGGRGRAELNVTRNFAEHAKFVVSE